MGGLFLNDILTNKKTVILYSLVVVLTSSVFFINWSTINLNNLSFLMPTFKILCLTGGIYAINAITHCFMLSSENKIHRQFVTATPSRSKGMVIERYIMNFAVSLLICGWYALGVYIQNSVHGSTGSEMHFIYFGFFIFLISQALELPLLFRFGAGYGKYYKGATGILLLLVLVVIFLCGPDILPSMDTILQWFITFDFSDLFDKIKTAMKIIPFVTLVIYGISLTITIFLVKSK